MASVCYAYVIPQLTSTTDNWSHQNFMRHETQKVLFNGNSKREITIDNVDSLKVFFFSFLLTIKVYVWINARFLYVTIKSASIMDKRSHTAHH